MNFALAESTRANCDRFMSALPPDHDQPIWHIPRTQKQKPMECAPRSLLDLSDQLVNWCRSAEPSDPHRLPRDSLTGSKLGKATKELNREAYAHIYYTQCPQGSGEYGTDRF